MHLTRGSSPSHMHVTVPLFGLQRCKYNILFLWFSFFIFEFFFFKKKYSSLMKYIPTTGSFPFLLFWQCIYHTRDPLFLYSTSVKAGLPGISTKHGITNHSKTKHIPSIKTGLGNSVKVKEPPKQTKESETDSLLLLGGLTLPSCTTRTYAEDIGQTQERPPDCCFSLCEFLWTLVSWFYELCSCGVLGPSASFLPTLLQDSPSPSNVWLWFSASVPISCCMKPLWWRLS